MSNLMALLDVFENAVRKTDDKAYTHAKTALIARVEQLQVEVDEALGEANNWRNELLVALKRTETRRCTANTRKFQDWRCVRELGHGGLHRFEIEGSIIEFPDSESWFPHYNKENL